MKQNQGFKKSIIQFFVLFFFVLNFAFVFGQENKSMTVYPAQNIYISEIMINPQTVPDKYGEWFEIFNPTSTPVNINGWIIYDLGTNFHIINNGGALIIPPHDFIVLCRSGNPNYNGGLNPDYVYYGTLKFDDSSDEIILATGFGFEIDRVEYSTSNGWPSANGESIIYTGIPGQNNNNSTFWQLSGYRENGYISQGSDKGSPGSNGNGQNSFISTTWTGTGNWTEGNAPGNSNWSNGSPGQMTSVIIIDAIDIYENVSCDNLNIEPFGSLTIQYSGNLDIEEDLTINSDNQALVSGSFIDLGTYSTGGISKYYRHIPDSGWHFLSSPIIPGSGFVTGDLVPDNGDAYMIAFNDGYDWGGYVASEEMTFETMKGYSVWLTAPKTISIEGIFNTGEIEYLPLNEGNKFNLVGNPYPSAINWASNTGWTRNRISQSIWLWNQDAGNYGIFLSTSGGGLSTNNASSYIPSCQGFFIQTTGSNPIIKVNNEARIHDDQAFFKSQDEPKDLLRISVLGEYGKDEIIILFTEGATDGLDENMDIEKLEGSEESPQLYSFYSEKQYSISSFPEITENKLVPVYFNPQSNGEFEIVISGISSFDDNISVILEDNQLNYFQEITEDFTYIIQADTLNIKNRFTVHFITNQQSGAENEPEIFSTNDYIYIRSYEPLLGNIEVFNPLGQSIIQSEIHSSINKIDMKGKKGVFILHLITNDLKISKKLFLD